MKRITRISSIVSAAIFVLFSLYAGNAFFEAGYQACKDVVVTVDESNHYNYSTVFTGISLKSLPFFGAMLFLAITLTFVVLRTVHLKKSRFLYISFPMTLFSAFVFLKLNTLVYQLIFVSYTLHLDRPRFDSILAMDIIRYALISLVLFAEATHLTVSIADQLQEHQKNKQMEKGGMGGGMY